MHQADYRRALESARAEYDRLIQQRVDLERRILQLKQTIESLAALCGAGETRTRRANASKAPFPSSISITGATRQILTEADSPITPKGLRDALAQRGVDVAQYANPLAVIHNTLRRLHRQGEAIQISGAWTLTHKGRLAAKLDMLDLPNQ
jgi:hypothetical protein